MIWCGGRFSPELIINCLQFREGLFVVLDHQIVAWFGEPERRLAFTLHARADLIPPTTLDSHVTIGGPFFDTLDGIYVLEPLPGGRTHVVLTSRHRLSTRFNVYSGLWSDAIMRSIQANILEIVTDRSLHQPRGSLNP